MKIRFKIPQGVRVIPSTDIFYVDEGEEETQELVKAVLENISTEVMIEVAGVEMFLAAWQDPEHWVTDWREKAIEEGDMYPEFDPYDYALALIHRAKEEG